jgi:hypothetical protein
VRIEQRLGGLFFVSSAVLFVCKNPVLPGLGLTLPTSGLVIVELLDVVAIGCFDVVQQLH